MSATAIYDPLHPWRENPSKYDPYLVTLHMNPLLHYYGCIAHAEAAIRVRQRWPSARRLLVLEADYMVMRRLLRSRSLR